MSRTNFEQLLEAGCHFGHLKRKWNPAMAPYIFMERNDIHIIDLHKTVVKVDEAAAALKSIAKSGRKILFVATKKQAKHWEGDRNMVDLCKVVKDYYYNPHTKGSNSIKAVLPAALNSSEFLKKKYSQPIGNIQLSSHNFPENHIWLQFDKESVVNPYKTLPPLFDNWEVTDVEENVSDIENIADGGAALTAYAKLQYVDMTPKEREEITQGLLKYCELDTLAMVRILEVLRKTVLFN